MKKKITILVIISVLFALLLIIFFSLTKKEDDTFILEVDQEVGKGSLLRSYKDLGISDKEFEENSNIIYSRSDNKILRTYGGRVFSGNLLVPKVYENDFEHLGYGFYISRDRLYYFTKPHPTIDYKTLELLNEYYSRDYRGVYYNGSYNLLIKSKDAETFRVFKGPIAYDDNYVYYSGQRFVGADMTTLKSGDGFFVDKDHVFTRLDQFDDYLILDSADPESFQKVGLCTAAMRFGRYYYRDNNGVFIHSEKLDYIDHETFEYLGTENFITGVTSYAKDKNNVYIECGDILGDVNPETFVVLGYGYSKDDQGVYYVEDKIESADPKTFVMIDKYYAIDENHIYYRRSKIEGVNARDIRIVEYYEENSSVPTNYIVDGNNVYFYGKLLESAEGEKCSAADIYFCNPDDISPPNFGPG
jgi:hypothetical protein